MRSDNSAVLLFGAAYYAEYQPELDLERDFALMAEAGFSVIRVGESVWSTWEPEDGVFDLEWLEPVLDAARAHGIGVILGTPTYAVPPWLQRKHPEIAAESSTGTRVGWGARQEMDFTHPAFRLHAERIIRAVVGRYHDHPAVIGFQVDNEPGLRLLFNEGVFQRFVDELRHTYGTVDALNEEWGLVYWSHRLSTWADLWRPDGNFQPQYDLAWRRFQARLTTEFIAWEASIVREIVGDEGFVTTCLSYDQVAVEDVDLSANLDIASGNAYYEMEDSLAHPSALPREAGWIIRGTWALFDLANLMWSSKQAPFLVTETNADSIGFSALNFSPFDGQWRQAAWALVARGARMIEYWHWHTLHFGTETYWGGVLPHSGQPGRAYREIATIGAEFARAGDAFESAVPDADITVLYDSDSKFALSAQGHLGAPGVWVDTDSYRRTVSAFTRGIFDAKRQTRTVRPQQLFPSRGGDLSPADAARLHPILVVAAFYTAADGDLDWLTAYAAAGGHLVLGPRTAYADREARARRDRQPARIASAAGVWYDEFANLNADLPVVADGGSPLAGGANAWVDGLTLDGATALAGYDHPHFGRWPAITTAQHGTGAITVVGTVPDQELAESLAGWLAPQPVSGWVELPPSVTVASSTAADGSRVFVVHNWSFDAVDVLVPTPMTDLLSPRVLAAGDALTLGSWDVAVLSSTNSKGPAL